MFAADYYLDKASGLLIRILIKFDRCFEFPLKFCVTILYSDILVFSYFDDLHCYRAEAAAREPHRAAQLQVSGPRDSSGCLPGTVLLINIFFAYLFSKKL